MNRLVVAAAAAVALAVAVPACGLGGDDELQRIDSNDLFGLDETTSTSTTSTTTTVVPPPLVDSTIGVTTTTVATEPVELYFIDGDRLADVVIPLTRGTQGPSALRVMRALERGLSSGDVGIGLRSAVPPNLVTTVTESAAGFASVDLSGTVFETIEDSDQRLAFAQIVLTLTRRPGIGQVQFTVDGVPLAVPGRDNVIRDPGELVSFEDYESLLVERDTETTVAVTHPTSTTVAPTPATI